MSVVLLVEFGFLLREAESSIGDHHPKFVECIAECIHDLDCPQTASEIGWIFEPCFSCRHGCMWKTVDYITNVLRDNVPQFYGKWPFIAVRLPLLYSIPIQEVASVAFSFMNMLAALKLYLTTLRLSRGNRMRTVWMSYSLLGVIVWIFSALFHWSDFWLTEYLDYFSACAVIVYTVFASISLSFPFLQRSFKGRLLWCTIFLGLFYSYFKHIQRLWVHFDYGYNMKFCITFSVMASLIYYIWIAVQYRNRKLLREDRISLYYLGLSVTWGIGSIVLEVFDFVPVFWLIDAHSLFHLATVPIPLWMIRFVELESEYERLKYTGYLKLS